MQRNEFGTELFQRNVFRSKKEAIGEIVSMVDHAKCRVCSKRVFQECTKFKPLEQIGEFFENTNTPN